MKNTSKTTEKKSKKRLSLAIVAVMALLSLVAGGACARRESEADKITKAAHDIKSYFSIGVINFDMCTDSYDDAQEELSHGWSGDKFTDEALSFLDTARIGFRNALDVCEDYEEFSEIKSDLEVIYNTINDTITDDIMNSNDTSEKLTAISETIKTIKPYIKSVQEKIDAWQFD